MKKLNKINDPFGCFCYNLGFRPTVYSEALTYEEQLLWLIDFLQKTVIPAVNDSTEAVEELQALYIELKSYVDSYFENLDVQEEIDHKLDEMVEQGTLQEIITSYLQVNGVLAYDTIGDMSYSENLIDGSTCYCLGDLTYNDGKGGFYKVREIVNTDVVDDFNIVALDVSNELIAERMPDYYINELNTNIGTLSNLTTTNKTNLVSAINEINEELSKKLTELVIFGDSWCDERNVNTVFPDILEEELKLNVHNYGLAGAGFVQPATNLMSSQITTFNNDTTYDKSAVKYVVILAGINDLNNNVDFYSLATAINSFISTIKPLMPNATILYASNFRYPYTHNDEAFWLKTHNLVRVNSYVKTFNMSGIFGKPLMTNDFFHLNDVGQQMMAGNLISCLTGGEIIGYSDNRIYTGTNGSAIYSTLRTKYQVLLTIKLTLTSTSASGTLTLSDTDCDVSYRGDMSRIAGNGVGNNNFEVAIQNGQLAYSFGSAVYTDATYNACVILPIDTR